MNLTKGIALKLLSAVLFSFMSALIRLLGVLVMLAPYLDLKNLAAQETQAQVGVMLAVAAAFCNAGSVIQTRRLTDSETTSSIVFYFSLFCAIAGLLTLPFAWHT